MNRLFDEGGSRGTGTSAKQTAIGGLAAYFMKPNEHEHAEGPAAEM